MTVAFETRNFLAKIVVIAWIAALLFFAFTVAKTSVTFDPNVFFALGESNRLPESVVREMRILLLMLSVSIVGGLSFVIKDFYKSVKYANLYDRAYEDFREGLINRENFSRLITVEAYSGRFNYTWLYWFFVQPVLSSVLGIIAFFIARSGLGVLQGASIDAEITVRSIYLYAVFTFLAGFSSHKFIAWLDALADKIFAIGGTKEKIQSEVRNAAATDRMALLTEVSGDSGSGAESETVPNPAADTAAAALKNSQGAKTKKGEGKNVQEAMKAIR